MKNLLNRCKEFLWLPTSFYCLFALTLMVVFEFSEDYQKTKSGVCNLKVSRK